VSPGDVDQLLVKILMTIGSSAFKNPGGVEENEAD
jgi:hypothetical protein